MSAEQKNQKIPKSASAEFDAVSTTHKISHTRDFLLSLSSLDSCKKLPSDFDESLRSEVAVSLLRELDRARNPSSLPFQVSRQTQYSLLPLTEENSSDNPRGIHGKWESWRSDRESNSQSNRDADSGRRYGHQSRGSWHTREQEGLLGSGSLARPFGHTSGMSAPKMRPNEQNQLNKSNEPYHPPRPYRAVPHARRGTDSFNDETFGSTESTSEDRAEEERMRRASFETIRKEQQRILRENQKLNLEKHKDGGVADIREVLDDSRDEKEPTVRNNEMELSAGIPIVSNNLEKLSLPSISPPSRPPLQPGFRNSVVVENICSKSPSLHNLSEVLEPVTGKTLSDVEISLSPNGKKDAYELQLEREITSADEKLAADVPHAVNQEENLLSNLDVPIQKLSEQDHFSLSSNHFSSHESFEDLEKVKFDAKVLAGIASDMHRNNSTSVEEDLFDATLSIDDNGSTTSYNYGMPNAPNSAQSSKFAQWFFEEETKIAAVPSRTPADLLSILVNGDKGQHKVSGVEAAEHFTTDFSHKTWEQLNQEKAEELSVTNGISNQPFRNNNEETVPAVVTCEDLEQSILSEYRGDTTITQHFGIENTEHIQPHIDGNASLHLLSLLQKGTCSSIKPAVSVNSADNFPSSSDHGMVGTSSDNPRWEENNGNLSNSDDKLTLETLFGTAFMNELQSVGAPVSIERGSTRSAQVDTSDPPGLPFPVSDVAIMDKPGPQRPRHDNGVLTSNHGQLTRLNMSQNWHASEDSQNDLISSLKYIEESPKNIDFQPIADIQLPEKNPISANDPQNHWMSKLMSTGSSSNSKNSLDGGKLAPFGIVKDQHMVSSEIQHLSLGHHEQLMSQTPFRSPQMQQSSPYIQGQQIPQMRPLYHHMDSHPSNRRSDKMFLGPESIFTHDSSAIHHFPSNASRPLWNNGGKGFENPSHPTILHHQMHLPGNRPFMLPDFARGGPVSRHGSQSTISMQENELRGLPYDPRMPNIGTRGVPFSDVNSAGKLPEAFQRLIEMELRAPRRYQGFDGLQPDMGFHYG